MKNNGDFTIKTEIKSILQCLSLYLNLKEERKQKRLLIFRIIYLSIKKNGLIINFILVTLSVVLYFKIYA